MAVTSLDGLLIFERILLLFTEQVSSRLLTPAPYGQLVAIRYSYFIFAPTSQSQYPPNHYIRRCPQQKIHKFTLLQLSQLLVMCLLGFSPINVVEMFFPVIILLMIPFRHKIVPKFVEDKYLDSLDAKHQNDETWVQSDFCCYYAHCLIDSITKSNLVKLLNYLYGWFIVQPFSTSCYKIKKNTPIGRWILSRMSTR